jgi:hypothetical protein
VGCALVDLRGKGGGGLKPSTCCCTSSNVFCLSDSCASCSSPSPFLPEDFSTFTIRFTTENPLYPAHPKPTFFFSAWYSESIFKASARSAASFWRLTLDSFIVSVLLIPRFSSSSRSLIALRVSKANRAQFFRQRSNSDSCTSDAASAASCWEGPSWESVRARLRS